MFNVIGISVVFLLLIYIEYKLSNNKCLTLPSLLTYYWNLLIILGVIVYYKTYDFNYKGFFCIILMCYIYFLSYYCMNNYLIKINYKTKKNQYVVDNKSINMIIYYSILCLVFLRMIGLVYFLMINDIGISNFLGFDNFMDTLNTLTLIKYHAIPSNYSPLISITNTVSFVGLLIFGFFYSKLKKNQRRILTIECCAVFAVSMIITASKSDIIFAVLIFLSSFIIEYLHADVIKILKKQYKRFMIIVFLGIIVLLGLGLFISVRSGFTKNPIDGLKQYAFGMIPAFDFYFENMLPQKLSYGKYTFLGILEFIGYQDSSLPMGVYHEIDLGVGNYSTNIFTAFRSLIDDFGIGGTALFFILLGIITSLMCYKYSTDKTNATSISVLSFVTFFILNSFLISAGNYFSICLSYIIFWMYLLALSIINYKLSNKGER